MLFPKDAKVIADQVRTRDDLRPVTATSEIDAELRLLVARRRELVADQVRRKGRVRDLLVSVHPGLVLTDGRDEDDGVIGREHVLRS